MQLRFRIAYRAAQHRGNFVVLVTVHIMKKEHGLVALRQLREGGVKIDAVEEADEALVGSTDFKGGPLFFIIGPNHVIQRDCDGPFFSEAHEDDIGGEAVQPGRKRRFTAKGVDLAKELQESFLSQVLRFLRVTNHAKTESVDAAAVHLVDGFKRCRITLLSQADGFFERSGIRLERLSRLWWLQRVG